MVVQAMKQEKFTDIEYSFHKKKTKREEFLEIMDEIIPWDEWVGVIKPYYPTGKRGRPPMGIEKMLRMYLLQIWFNLSDPATEDAIYDSSRIYRLGAFPEVFDPAFRSGRIVPQRRPAFE